METQTANATLVEQIRERGFAVVPDVISADAVAKLKRRLQEAIAEDLKRWSGHPYYRDAYMVMNLMTRGAVFLELLDNPTLHAYFDKLLSETCIVYAYTSSSMPPKGTNYSRRIHVDCPRLIPGYITNIGVTLALDDFTTENGATYLLPGSFRHFEEPSGDEFWQNAERVFPRAGDAIIFNARTWHSGGMNETDDFRHAVTLNVCRSYMRQQFDFPPMMDSVTVDALSPRVRRFLGFDVRMPSSLEEYYVAPELRLYKADQG